MSNITETQAREKCQKHNLIFSSINRDGNYSKCRVNLLCSNCSSFIEYSYAELHKRKTCLCKNCLNDKLRLPKEDIIKRLGEFGASLVDISQYTISTEPIDIKCKCGAVFKLRANDIPKCKDISCKNCKGLYTNQDIEKFCSENNINLIKIESNNKIKIKCKICESKLCKSFRSLRIQQKPYLCRSCFFSTWNNPQKKEISIIQKILSDNELTGDLSNYKNASSKIPLVCRCGRKFFRSWNTIRAYELYKCHHCSKKQNKIEELLESKIKTLKIEYNLHDRSITGKEIDIYFPGQNFGIEINGTYWHSDLLKNKRYHLEKTKEFLTHKIDIINIHEAEIRTKLDIVFSIIKKKLKLIDKINQKFSVSQIERNVGRSFFTKNHLKGNSICNVYYGIFLQSKLISCVGISTKNGINNIKRFCNHIEYNIPNSIDIFIKYFNENNIFNNLKFYIDRRLYFNGIFTQFATRIKETNPTYVYSKSNKIIYRSQINKQNAKKFISDYDNSISLYKNMKNNRYYRIWDCGNLVYEWKNE